MPTERKMPYAHHLPGWKFDGGSREVLKASRRVAPDEYEQEMMGSLFCPSCYTNVERTPKEKNISTNGRAPFYRHLQHWKHIACVRRAKKPAGKRYDTWEEAKRAIEHEHLAIVKEFLQVKPELRLVQGGEYDETPVEDIEGPLSEVPIGRHEGESFELPSKITTVAGICRDFEKNKDKYFFLPQAAHAVKLAELLTDIADVDYDIMDTTQTPRLYYGKIMASHNAGSHDNSTRMTRLVCNPAVKDFYLKLPNGFCRDKGITDKSNGRIVMFFGKITESGIGLAATHLAWGEVALVPTKYNELLIPE
jgi:hypothetical protein